MMARPPVRPPQLVIADLEQRDARKAHALCPSTTRDAAGGDGDDGDREHDHHDHHHDHPAGVRFEVRRDDVAQQDLRSEPRDVTVTARSSSGASRSGLEMALGGAYGISRRFTRPCLVASSQRRESPSHWRGARVEFALAYGTKTLAPARTLASYELHTEARVSIDGRRAARREERLRPPLEM